GSSGINSKSNRDSCLGSASGVATGAGFDATGKLLLGSSRARTTCSPVQVLSVGTCEASVAAGSAATASATIAGVAAFTGFGFESDAVVDATVEGISSTGAEIFGSGTAGNISFAGVVSASTGNSSSSSSAI